MKLVLDDADVFRKSIEGISVLIDEAEFVLDEEGLTLKATDPSQISLVDYSLPKKAFSAYTLKGSTRIGLDLDGLAKVMRRAKTGEQLTLELDEDKNEFKVGLKGKSARSFKVPLLDVSSSELPIPKIEFDAEVLLTGDVIQEGLKDASLFSTHITLAARKDNFVMKAESSKGNIISETAKGEGVLELNIKKECASMFPLDYLQDMIKSAQSDTKVKLKLKSNAPVEIEYPIGQARIRYFLAPRIESKEMEA